MSNSHWYVPVPGLIAYGAPATSFYRPPPVALGDQTLWTLEQASNGVFTGRSEAILDFGGTTSSSSQAMQGLVTPSGQIAIVFSQPEAPSTIGIGQMREAGGVPLMEMQMVTGSGFLVTHWAYMTPYNPAVFTPPPPSQVVTDDLTSPQWRWTAGTTWRISSPALFGTAAPGTFKISDYSSGYYWGLGAAPPGSPVGNFTILGSITPEGNVLFNLLSDGELSSLSGQITGNPSTGIMVLRPYLGGGTFGPPSGAGIMPVSDIRAGQTYFISDTGTTVVPAFAGGTLQVDTMGQSYGQDFTLDASPTNRLDQRGAAARLSGRLSDAAPGTPGRLIIANSAAGGSITLSGASSHTGPTFVEAGATLLVDGSIVSPLTVAGTLGGSGRVADTRIAGGTLAPGTLAPGSSTGTLTVAGDLSFAPGSVYLVEVAPDASDRTDGTGMAELRGTAVLHFASGSYSPAPQVLLSADGGRSGTFGDLVTFGLPPGLLASLSYTPAEVMLNLTAALGAGMPLTANQGNVAGALNSSFNSGNSLPGGMADLFNQGGQTLASSLDALSGEAQAGAPAAAFGYGSLFLDTLQATGAGGGGRQDVQYAPLTPEAEPAPGRWRAWTAGFGGYGWLGGMSDSGSADLQTSAQGIAAGADRRFDYGLVGLAVSGGRSDWTLDEGLGNGQADIFQVGLYGRAMPDPIYLAAAAALGRHDVSVQRPVPFLGDRNRASYTATGWSGRLEAGHRFAFEEHGVTPFVAAQSQVLDMPGFCEMSQTGSGAALCIDGNATWALRSVLGLQLDADAGSILGARGNLAARLAWAHDYRSTGSVQARFQALPGAGFTMSGAPLPQDTGIVGLTSDMQFDAGWGLRLQADAGFGKDYRSVAGTARLSRRF